MSSPDASEPVRPIVLHFSFGIGQPRQHSWRRFPGHFAVATQVPHGVAGFFKFPQNFGQQLRFSAIIAIVCSSVALAVDPESQSV